MLACLVAQDEVAVFPRVFPLLMGVAAALQTLVKPGAGLIALVALGDRDVHRIRLKAARHSG